jgi:hypothetical protein
MYLREHAAQWVMNFEERCGPFRSFEAFELEFRKRYISPVRRSRARDALHTEHQTGSLIAFIRRFEDNLNLVGLNTPEGMTEPEAVRCFANGLNTFLRSEYARWKAGYFTANHTEPTLEEAKEAMMVFVSNKPNQSRTAGEFSRRPARHMALVTDYPEVDLDEDSLVEADPPIPLANLLAMVSEQRYVPLTEEEKQKLFASGACLYCRKVTEPKHRAVDCPLRKQREAARGSSGKSQGNRKAQ